MKLFLALFLSANFLLAQGQVTSQPVYAFIGQKIFLTEFDPNAGAKIPYKVEIDSTTGDTITRYHQAYVMDKAFNAKYNIIKNVYNELPADTIDFKVYDHYGRPAFEKYDAVILYISKSSEGDYYFHRNYQFDPVHKNKKGKWRGVNGKSVKALVKARIKKPGATY